MLPQNIQLSNGNEIPGARYHMKITSKDGDLDKRRDGPPEKLKKSPL
jgi:hypothetical protein